MRPFVAVALAVICVAFLGSVVLVDRLLDAGATAARSVESRAAVAAPPVDADTPTTREVTAPVPVSPPVASALRSRAPQRPPATARTPERVRSRAVVLPPAPDAGRRLDLSFRVDPRLTRSLHMGDRWVSPPTYSLAGDAGVATVEARALGGGASSVAAWMPSEPDMVDVSPDEGNQVKITVLRAGESRLTVSSGGISKVLYVEAKETAGGALRVNISH